MPREEQPIIIKKIKKAGHGGGHHGGAWKVAYADFVTAMMALFLVLWLVAVMSIDAKKRIAEYFRSFTVFQGPEAGGATGISIMQGGPVKLDKDPGDIKNAKNIQNKLVAEIGKIIEEKLKGLKEQILVFTTNEGVRIELTEKTGTPLFETGKNNLLRSGEDALKVLTETIMNLPNNIVIEGHTDSQPYPGEGYTNWELAADRANAARRAIIKYGLDPKRIKRVASFADALPIKPDDPYDGINRRISILIEVKQQPTAIDKSLWMENAQPEIMQ
ncbi:MAG: OmpA family protein [Deltaproteobacteria bacterium]|nr:OmpA family protein [Deltaproteobacteria bacterium]